MSGFHEVTLSINHQIVLIRRICHLIRSSAAIREMNETLHFEAVKNPDAIADTPRDYTFDESAVCSAAVLKSPTVLPAAQRDRHTPTGASRGERKNKTPNSSRSTLPLAREGSFLAGTY